MLEGNTLTILVVLGLSGVFLYQASFLKKKKLWHISLQQLMMLVLIPSVFFPMIFSYLLDMMDRPLAHEVFISDKVLINLVLLSLLFAYGGIAIHAVTKILSDQFHEHGGIDEVVEVNRFFHTSFSHNLSVVGIMTAMAGITILELNHVADTMPVSMMGGIAKGLLLGFVFASSAFNYTRYTTGDMGRWYDLRFLFGAAWLMFVLLLYQIKRSDPNITNYQLLLPSLLSFSVMVLLSLVLAVRKVKRGDFKVRWKWKRLRGLLQFVGNED